MYFVKLYGGGVTPPEVFNYFSYEAALRAAEQLIAVAMDQVVVCGEEGIRVW